MSSPHLPPRGGNPKKKKGKHRRPRPEGGFDDSGPGGMSPPSPPFGPSLASSSPPSSFENDSGSFPSQAAPHSSDDHDQRVPGGGGGSSSKGEGKGKNKNKKKGQGGGIGKGEGEMGPGFSMPFGTDAFGKPTIHLHSHIEGLFKEQDHDIGGSYSDAVLEHWRQLDSGKKLAVVTVDRDGIFDALRELHLTAQVAVEGEPGEEAAQAVVKDFLYALEVQDGKFRFPEAPSLEYIGIFVALETNLLLSMEEVNVLQHGVMVWLLLLWRQRYWWVGWLATLAIVLGTHTACVAVRAWVQRFLNATFLERRRWHAYVHWKYEAFFVSLLTIALAGGTAGWSPRWYWAAVALGLAQLALDHQALRMAAAGKGDEQTGAVALRQGLLWIQKVLLLVLAYPAWSSFVAVLGYYFPAAAILGLSMLYLGVGLGIRLLWGLLHDYGLARVSPRFKAALDAWWHEGRDGLNRAVVVAIVAVLLVPYTFYKTWDWAPRWKGTGARFLSVLVVANVVSMEDLQRAGALLKDGLGRVFSRGRGEGKAAKAAAAAAAAENEKGQDEDAAGAADAGEDEAGADDVDDKDKMD